MKQFYFLIMCLLAAGSLRSQSKVFKEVGEEMSTQVKPIMQDNTLVGYLAFTRLEKADADSFNYRATILDENLHDIGKVNFRQAILILQSVTFEQNVLCLGYIQISPGARHVVLQFINLNGQIVNNWTRAVSLSMTGFLRYGMQMRNIPNAGFAFFYGDEAKQSLLTFDLKGNLGQEQDLPFSGTRYFLRTSPSNVYLLTKRMGHTPEGDYQLYVYSAKDLTAETNFELRDGYDNPLKVLTFDNDPATGDPFIAGCIINPRRAKQFFTANDYSYTPYLGLFTLELGNAHTKMNANCSYWSNQHFPGIGEDGMFTDKGFYVRYVTAFRDYSGNTLFAGTALVGKGYVGAAKYKLMDGVFVRQEESGSLALDNNIPCDVSRSFGESGILPELDKKEYYKVVDPDSKSNYMIIDDEVNIYVYNASTRKVVRMIPHKDGRIKVSVFPAKEGHMMVAEYNGKEKYTRFSIEAL